MSLEEEVAELSLAYHGYREENEELRRLVRDYMVFAAGLSLPASTRSGTA